MLPGKTYAPEDLLRILKRRFWLLLLPLALVSAGTAFVVSTLPDLYRSETLILVVPQQVPQDFVRQTVTTRIEDSLQSMRETVLSRTRLEGLIREFDLYPEERSTMLMEQVVALMRANVQVEVVQNDAFRMAYIGKDPVKVMQVTNELADSFIQESYVDRRRLAEGTDEFLETELELTRQRLLEKERALENYRQQYAGELPSQVNSNLQQLASANQQIQAAVTSINVLRQQRLVLERQLLQLQTPGAVPLVEVDPETGEPSTTAQLLAEQRALLIEQESRLLEGHPDLSITRRRISELESQLARELAADPEGTSDLTPAELARRQQIAGLEEDIAEIDRQVADHQRAQEEASAAARASQARIDALPRRESEMTELLRDYGTMQDTYGRLLANREEARMASNLESRQIGEQFRVLDPAQVAELPFSPNRPRLVTIGMLAGIMIGAGLLLLTEYRDRTFKTDEEVAAISGLPVLAVVPLMRSPADRRAARWRTALSSAVLGLVVVGCLGFVGYTFMG